VNGTHEDRMPTEFLSPSSDGEEAHI
jgi:hypothetical protein